MEPTPSPYTPARLPADNRSAQLIESRPQAPQPSAGSTSQLDLGEIYYMLFRQKWKLLVGALLGISGAAGFFFLSKPTYHSEAKLFVRYVVTDAKSGRTGTDDALMKSPDMRGETIIASEQQILTSMDLATRAAERIGPAKILGDSKSGTDVNTAAAVIRKGLVVDAPKLSSVIQVTFQHHDSTLVQPVLREVIEQYLKMHHEVHRAAGMLGDFLTQETDQLRSKLVQTEEELRKANQKAGVISVEEAKQGISKQLAGLREAIMAAEAELAERAASVAALQKKPAAPEISAPAAPPPSAEVPREKIDEYRRVLMQLDGLLRKEQELLLRFTGENILVKETRQQIDGLESARRELESAYPALIARVPSIAPGRQSAAPPTPDNDLAMEGAKVVALQAKIRALSAQADALKREAATLDDVEGKIADLRRRKQLEENNYLRYAASLEQSRINEALGSGKVSNISVIQAPSIPLADPGKVAKTAAGIGFGGLALGIAWALAIEMLFDRSVRRPNHVERLRLPLLISLPSVRAPKSRRRRHADGNGEAAIVPQGAALGSAALHPFHETLRDRLIGYFERRNLTHKPKLIAVTGLGGGVGATTIASGLAASLSKTGDGNVLLVDMTTTQGAVQQFIKGQAVCGLEEMLGQPGSAQVDDNLFVVTDNKHTDSLSRNLPQRFAKLVPQLKASDFDYIIFDMPAVSEISVTPRLAGFMDIVLLVLESEKSDQTLAQRAVTLLAESRCHVGAVLNKTRSYVPSWVHPDALAQPN